MKTVSDGEIHSFSFGSRDGVALVRGYSDLQTEFYPDLLRFASIYSPAGVVILAEEKEPTRFALYQHPDRTNDSNRLDLDWIVNGFNRLEDGWQIKNAIAISPDDSKLKLSTIQDAVKVGRVGLEPFEQLRAILKVG